MHENVSHAKAQSRQGGLLTRMKQDLHIVPMSMMLQHYAKGFRSSGKHVFRQSESPLHYIRFSGYIDIEEFSYSFSASLRLCVSTICEYLRDLRAVINSRTLAFIRGLPLFSLLPFVQNFSWAISAGNCFMWIDSVNIGIE